jgi:Ca-activated chloride channel family protein
MSQPTVLITPLRPALPNTAHDVETHALVRISVPEADAAAPARAPLHLSLVIDRSGSMAGKPLVEAKRCAQFVVGALRPTDRCSVIAYDDEVSVLSQADSVGDRHLLQNIIASISEGGSTNLHGGWLAGAQTLRVHVAPEVLSRVILLSDGCANAGLTGADAIAEQCASQATAGVTTSTYGLGTGFNELLMHRMAQAGQGNAYYGQTADDLMGPFTEELSLLDALYGRSVRLTLKAAPGVTVTLVNTLAQLAPDSWRLPDLARGGDTWALVRLRVPAAPSDEPQALFTAQISYDSMQGVAVQLPPVTLSLPRVADAVYGALAADPTIEQRIDELGLARVATQAREAALNGDWDRATQLLASMESKVAGNPWLAGVHNELRMLVAERDREGYGKEALYSAMRMSSRRVSSSESMDMMEDAQIPEFLRRKTAQGKSRPKP